jgi:hypothetical protein
MRKILLVLMVVGVGGCGLMNSRYLAYNFSRDQVLVANVGAEMIEVTEERKNDVYGTVLSKFESTLTYSGKEGTVIKIIYRESSDDFARPAFNQELTYDIADDKVITFRDTKIRILKATNSMIKFVVLESPAYTYQSGAKITEQ